MNASDELSLRDFFHILRRRKRGLAVWWSLIFIAVAIYTVLVPPLYRTQVLLRLQLPEEMTRSIQIGAENVLSEHNTPLNVDALISPESLHRCLEQLGEIKPGMNEHEVASRVNRLAQRASVKAKENDPQLVTLSVVGDQGGRITREANALSEVIVELVSRQMAGKAHQAKAFIEDQLRDVETRLHESEDKLRKDQERFGPQATANFLLGRLMELKAKRSQLAQKYTPAYPEFKQIDGQIETLEDQLRKLPTQEVDMARVARKVRLNEELYTMLMKRLEDARIVDEARIAPVTILEPALEPTRPERPNKPFNLAAGFLLGLLISCGVVWTRHQLDSSLLTIHEIEQMLQLPILAMVPHIERRQKDPKLAIGPVERKVDQLGQQRSRLILHFPPKSPAVEVYHILRTNLLKAPPNGHSQVILFTSAVVREGKSLTAANFAIAAAQAGIPTLLVEMDLRKPTLDRLFGIPNKSGLTNYFYQSPRWETYLVGWDKIQQGEAGLAQAINTSGMTNLRLLPSGKIPPTPISLLSSGRMIDLFEEMRRHFPLVVVDCAPVVLFADCSLVAPHGDGVILVYRFGRTDRDALKQSHRQLLSVKSKVLGVVVNDMTKGETADYSPYYSSYQTPT